MKKAVVVVLLVIAAIILYSLSRQIYSSMQAQTRLDEAASELVALQKENSALKNRYDQTQTLSFLESMSRDKLGLVKPGETMVIISDKDIQKALSAQKPPVPEPKLPNWQGWLKLFWH